MLLHTGRGSNATHDVADASSFDVAATPTETLVRRTVNPLIYSFFKKKKPFFLFPARLLGIEAGRETGG
jgi:hypothetical protein